MVRLGQASDWVRLEFAYDYMGRRISKRFMKTGDNPADVIEKGATVTWQAHSYAERFVYDGWMPVVSYKVEPVTGAFDGPKTSFAWGPDLSGGLGGAGGIGGLAIFSDDAPPDQGCSNPGPMMPCFDGTGNVQRMVTAAGAVVASYEYGPFGEVKGITGQEGRRNPIRGSTKWTDAETGLVYYGYRYYSASPGRWLGRDPTGETPDASAYRFVANGPTQLVDPLGLIAWGVLWRAQSVVGDVLGWGQLVANLSQQGTPPKIAHGNALTIQFTTKDIEASGSIRRMLGQFDPASLDVGGVQRRELRGEVC